MTASISMFVPGVPAPGGSKKFVGMSKPRPGQARGHAILIDAAGEKNKNWRSVCAMVAANQIRGGGFAGPLKVSFEFIMPRPKGHYGKKGLKWNAPRYHTVRPDCTKLIRSSEDALTGIAWMDDAQIALQEGSKLYGDQPGCRITITPLT